MSPVSLQSEKSSDDVREEYESRRSSCSFSLSNGPATVGESLSELVREREDKDLWCKDAGLGRLNEVILAGGQGSQTTAQLGDCECSVWRGM